MPDTPPQYIDIITTDGTLRVVYEMTVGDLIVGGLIVLVIVFLLLKAIIRGLWRW